MRSGLFWRTFWAFSAITLAVVLLFTAVLAMMLRSERQQNYEDEVRTQAREVAEYMSHMNQLSYVRSNTTMQYIIRLKINDIHDRYNADIWLVSYNSGYVQYLDSSWNTSEKLYDDGVTEQLRIIHAGHEIRVQGLFPELGDQIVTIGVPWYYSDGQVVGAVLLHISVESLKINFFESFMKLMPAGLAVLLLGIILSYILAHSQAKPLREIKAAVTDFTGGDLERRVNLDCGGELQELAESLNQMAGELSRLEESRRSFVASVSHELRSPLTSMRGYVEGMLDGTIATADRERYLAVVRDETMRLSALVSDLLQLSRFESGKFPINARAFDINELMRRILIGFERRIEEKNIVVEVELNDDKLYVSGDPDRLMQVISNLIDNSVKFLPYGGRLKTGVHDMGKRVRVFVEDNGAGIPEGDIPYVFERFYKADKAHTSGMGTGLGLSIAKNILDQHGSRIDVSSMPGKTVFSFELDKTEGSNS